MRALLLLFILNLISCSQYELNHVGNFSDLASAEKNSCYFNLDSKGQLISWAPDTQIVFYFDSNMPEEYTEPIRQIASIWKNARGESLIQIARERRLSSTTQNDGSNIIYWINDASRFNNFEQARTVVRWTKAKIIDADILINAASFQYFLNPPVNGTKIHVPSLLVHEFGHALGLRHIPAFTSLMYANLNYLQIRTELSPVDITSMRCEYL